MTDPSITPGASEVPTSWPAESYTRVPSQVLTSRVLTLAAAFTAALEDYAVAVPYDRISVNVQWDSDPDNPGATIDVAVDNTDGAIQMTRDSWDWVTDRLGLEWYQGSVTWWEWTSERWGAVGVPVNLVVYTLNPGDPLA